MFPPLNESLMTADFSGTLGAVDLSGADIETALLTVQTQRATLLEDQLRDQMLAVQKRNQSIDTFNTILAAVRDLRPTGDKDSKANLTSGGTVGVPTAHYLDGQQAYIDNMEDQYNKALATTNNPSATNAEKTAAATLVSLLPGQLSAARNNLANAQASNAATQTISLQSALTMYGFTQTGEITQEEFDSLIQNITSRIDSLNSSQQLEMLRLQSLTNKRNEAFDVMTNVVKKMQDSRSSIVGNLR